jgi:hypothetical protein
MSDSEQPERITYYYPLAKCSEHDAAEWIGCDADYSGDPWYSYTVWRRSGIKQQFRLPDGGKTKAVAIDKEPISAPKVRHGVELRYRHGYWQKYLKQRGWVAA